MCSWKTRTLVSWIGAHTSVQVCPLHGREGLPSTWEVLFNDLVGEYTWKQWWPIPDTNNRWVWLCDLHKTKNEMHRGGQHFHKSAGRTLSKNAQLHSHFFSPTWYLFLCYVPDLLYVVVLFPRTNHSMHLSQNQRTRAGFVLLVLGENKVVTKQFKKLIRSCSPGPLAGGEDKARDPP